MRRQYAEPEVIPPGQFSRKELYSLSDDTLARLAALLDDAFVIPGTDIRFGLDPLIGLVPGIGDLLSSLASFLIIHAAWQRKVSRATVARMVANVAIDTLVGTIPILGDTFDVAWKSNRKNLTLLQRATSDSSGRQSWRDWMFLIAIAIVLLILVAVPIAALSLIIHFYRQH